MTNKTKKDEKLSAEQICKILHISKRKCAWMLQNGMIPCKDSSKKTRRYTVLRKDLDAYIKDSTEHPEKYFIPVTFTSNNPGKRESDKYYLYHTRSPRTSTRGLTICGTICPTSSRPRMWRPSSATSTSPSVDGSAEAGSRLPKPITLRSPPPVAHRLHLRLRLSHREEKQNPPRTAG
ncbi:MAG: helix-turn-helix domain-containing protein [Clostridia bacterium]|nr:helix-turn-helix domain-containing protein [Clostridia bacterium]